MKFLKQISFLIITIPILQGCGPYSFTGVNTTAKTFQVNYFQNNAPIIEPGIDREFTLALQNLIQNQTNLGLVTANADLLYEGEIKQYNISPMSATAQQTAAQNRLTIAVQVRFYNRQKPEEDFDRSFSFFYDYPANTQITTIKSTAHEEIFERITQDVFNATLANW